jgi:hypothetical protein
MHSQIGHPWRIASQIATHPLPESAKSVKSVVDAILRVVIRKITWRLLHDCTERPLKSSLDYQNASHGAE